MKVWTIESEYVQTNEKLYWSKGYFKNEIGGGNYKRAN